MEELQLTLTPSRIDQRNQGVMLANWRVGQTLNALVADRMPNGALILAVGGQTFISSKDIPVQPGTKVMLEVHQTEPKLVLKLLEETNSLLDPRPKNFNFGVELRPPAPAKGLAALMESLSTNALSDRVASSLKVQELERLLVNNFIRSGSITPGNVATAFISSGLFTEALWFANRSNLAAGSTKTILLLLKERIFLALRAITLSPAERKSLERMLGLVEAQLRSITYQQVGSIPTESGHNKWLTSLPLQLGEKLIELDIEIDYGSEQTGEPPNFWRLCLSFELETLGSIKALITSINNRFNIEFEVPDHMTNRVNDSLSLLRAGLQSAGLEVEKLAASSVKPTVESKESKSAKHIDLSA